MTPDPIIPFGKHKGEHASECPVSYLDWIIGQDWLKPDLKDDITVHLETRAEWHRVENE